LEGIGIVGEGHPVALFSMNWKEPQPWVGAKDLLKVCTPRLAVVNVWNLLKEEVAAMSIHNRRKQRRKKKARRKNLPLVHSACALSLSELS